MTRLKTATTPMSHQKWMCPVLIGGLMAPPENWPGQEMMPMPIRM
jgi:hypothetical protein